MSLDSDAEVSLATLVTFRYGAAFGTVQRYTSWANPITDTDGTFAVEPSIEVTINRQTAGSQDVPVQLRMLIQPPLDTLTSQRTHSPVRVEIEEVDPTDLTTRRKVFAGLVKMSDRNLDGRSGIVQIEIAGWRYSLDVMSNAWLATTTCNSVLGDVVCGIDLTTLQETPTVSAVDGNLVTVTGLTNSTTGGYWRFGYLAYDGLQITVREYTTGSQFTLLKTPPASWLGKTLTLTPGCDLRLLTCRNKFHNEARFTGFGLVIPAYNPLLESP
jgi:hypothetical protein